MTVVFVIVGGALGTLARYGLGRTVETHSLPWLTVGINVTGSFLLGLLIATGDWFSNEVRTGLAIGVLGGFTTFSTFSADIFLEMRAGDALEAAGLLVLSVLGGVAGAALGYTLGRALT